MSFPFYKQPDAMDCGPTCLRMVAKHYKRNISLQVLREKTQIGKEGVNLLGISEAAEAVGFRTQPIKVDVETLVSDAQLPAILHWNQNHFVVLYKVAKSPRYLWSGAGGEVVQIADPAKGLITYNLAEFRQHWVSDIGEGKEEGVALLLQPAPLFYQQAEGDEAADKTLKFGSLLQQYVLPYKKLVVQLFLGLAIASGLQLLLPFLTKSVVDVGINTANIHFVYIVLLAQLALFGGRLAVEFIRSWILLHISTRINLSILTDFLIKLMKLPIAFFDSKHTGDILQRMADHSRIEAFLTGTSLQTLFSLLNLLVFSVVLASFNSTIFLVFLIASILYGLWVVLFLKKQRALDYKRFDVAAREQSAAIQLVQAMPEIKLHGVERTMRWGWEGLQAKLFKLSVKSLSLTQWQQGGAFFINEGKNIFITFLSAKAVIDGQMTLGTMLAVQYIMGQLNSPVEQLVQFLQSGQAAKISMERLNEIHGMEDEEPPCPPRGEWLVHNTLLKADAMQLRGGGSLYPAFPTPPVEGLSNTHVLLNEDAAQKINSSQSEVGALISSPVGGGQEGAGSLPGWPRSEALNTPPLGGRGAAIRFANVSFTYAGAGNEPVLSDINLSIPEGATTAIVGASGSGKTTLLKLLLKFYEPQKGSIYLGSTPFSSISHSQWRAHCGVVMQESYIFSDTIARNIAVSAEKIDRERLEHAAVIANILDFIESLPLRFNTKIGAEGTGISAGQKQRLLIARAVYRDPHFIFLDEATNSLDAANESVIVNNLNGAFRNKTVVVVAHRLSTVRNADQIVVLNKGIITESGTHESLARLRGEYYTLVKNQLELGV